MGKVEITVNLLSRIRDATGEWNYYSAEDIENGIIVFAGVETNGKNIEPSGRFPNDAIEHLVVEKMTRWVDSASFRLTSNQVTVEGDASCQVIVGIVRKRSRLDRSDQSTDGNSNVDGVHVRIALVC